MKFRMAMVVFVVSAIKLAMGANILVIVPHASPSHHIWRRELTLELARRGHSITVVTSDLEKTPVPNVTEIHLDGSYEFTESEYDYIAFQNLGVLDSVHMFLGWGEQMCRTQMNSNGTKKLLGYPNKKIFDLIIMDLALNECFLPFIEKFGSPPVIGVSAFGNFITTSYTFGNPEPFAYSPNVFVPFTDKMTFKERFINTLVNLYTVYYRNYVYLPKVKQIADESFGYQVSPLENIESKVSMFLVNHILGIDYPKPVVPSIVGIGGVHLKPAGKLPKDLQEYLDNAKHGAILFSLGSNLRSDKLDEKTRNIIMKVLSELPQKVLWKFESDNLPGKPKNVMISKWLPQSSILARSSRDMNMGTVATWFGKGRSYIWNHFVSFQNISNMCPFNSTQQFQTHPNVKLFITHCGSLSIQEAMYRGVPIVGLPFFLDQHINLHKAVNTGFGEGFKFSEITEDKLRTSINKVLSNKTYYENVKRLSSIFHDQPEHPLERAVYWTEYVLRHNGAPHLRSAALDLEWYQYFLLDVIAVLILAVILFLWIIVITVRLLLKLFVRKKVKQH